MRAAVLLVHRLCTVQSGCTEGPVRRSDLLGHESWCTLNALLQIPANVSSINGERGDSQPCSSMLEVQIGV